MAKTIHEIASLAGVSTGTVSRVLNDRPNVSAKTRERVRQIVARFDYHPSAMARGLQGRRTGAVLLVVPSLEDVYCLRSINRFNSMFRAAGLRLMLGCSDWDPAVEAGYLRQIMDGGVDGLIITPVPATAETHRLYAALAERRIPVVTTELACPGGFFPSVVYDEAALAEAATTALILQGYTRIAFFACDMKVETVRQRHAGWLEAYRKAGLALAPGLVLTSDVGIHAVDFGPLLELARSSERPVAVLAQNDFLALRALLCLDEAGVRVPEDVKVIGYGNAQPTEFLKYPLESVDLPWQAMCERALVELRRQIDNKDLSERPEVIVLKSEAIN